MDFFDQNAPHAVQDTTMEATEFARALQQREMFVVPTASPRMLQALAKTPQSPTRRTESARPLPSRPPPPVTSPFHAFRPEDLVDLVSKSSTLVLDIRPHGQWKKARICRAINLAVPSTLLRRPAFSLDKIATMMPNVQDREAFQKWSSMSSIVVYDADSANLVDSSNVAALLTKVKSAGYAGNLGYLYGGINSVLLSSSLSSVVDDSPPPDDDAVGSGNQFLTVRQLSMSAFQQGTTTNANQRPELEKSTGAPGPTTTKVSVANPFYDNIRQHLELAGGITERIPLYIPRKVLKRSHELPFDWLRDIAAWAGTTAIMDLPTAKAGSLGPDGSDSARSSGTSGSKRLTRVNCEEGTEALAMQFYRIELGEQRRLQGVMQHHTHESSVQQKDGSDKPDYPLSDRVRMAIDFRCDIPTNKWPSRPALMYASQGVIMGGSQRPGRHPNDSEGSEQPEYFPFSITAGVEKGHKNRYRNIWPFDHARVRLRSEATNDGSDYINASYIQPRGTKRQYIATQGPLPSTYTDFWTLVWEQDVHIIVNLTKRVEGNSAKCGLYWKDGTYGPLHLRLVKQEGGSEVERAEEDNETGPAPTGFDFTTHTAEDPKKARRAKAQMERQLGKDYKPRNQDSRGDTEMMDSSRSEPSSSTEDEEDDSIIRRVFHLHHDNAPEDVRTVVQFQYVGWPDLNVPTSPNSLLKLMREVNALQEEFKESGRIGQYVGATTMSPSTSDARLRSHYQIRGDMAYKKVAAKRRSPTLVHCSAGVGRTGSYILIDAVLDAIRREARLQLSTFKPSFQDPTSPQSFNSGLQSQDPEMGPSIPVDGQAVSGRLAELQSMGGRVVGPDPFASRSSVQLPEMSALSVDSPFSMSPPKPSSIGGSSLTSVSAIQFSSPLTYSTMPTSHRASLPLAPSGSRSALKSTSVQSFTPWRPDPKDVGSLVGSTRNLNTSNHPSTTFEYMTPRQIYIPQHSRKHHNLAQMSKLTALEGERRQRHALQSSGLMDIDESSPPEDSPSPLENLDEPVRQVLEGIREQRMSMCQSLRQYVFVHRAILEGALMAIDEVKAELESERTGETSTKGTEALSVTQNSNKLSPPKNILLPSSRLSAPPPPPPHHASMSVSPPFRLTALTTSASHLGAPIAGNKRLASPTELQRVDAQGTPHTIHKRPSLKRINMSSDASPQSTT